MRKERPEQRQQRRKRENDGIPPVSAAAAAEEEEEILDLASEAELLLEDEAEDASQADA